MAFVTEALAIALAEKLKGGLLRVDQAACFLRGLLMVRGAASNCQLATSFERIFERAQAHMLASFASVRKGHDSILWCEAHLAQGFCTES
jgi:hypothetical protein